MSNIYAQFTYDDTLEMKEAGLLATTTNGTIKDLGEGLFDGYLVLDVSAVEIATGDEKYTISIEGSTVAAMTSASVGLGSKVFGNLVVPMDGALSTAGRYVIPFRNEEGGTLFRYIRVHTLVAGTIATGINFSAFLAKR